MHQVGFSVPLRARVGMDSALPWRRLYACYPARSRRSVNVAVRPFLPFGQRPLSPRLLCNDRFDIKTKDCDWVLTLPWAIRAAKPA